MGRRRRDGTALALAALLVVWHACTHPRVPTLATALLAAGAPAPDSRRIGTPPWARLVATWGTYPMTHGSIEAAAFARNDRLVTLNEFDGSLRFWDVPARALVVQYDDCTLPHASSNRGFGGLNRYRLALSADGRLAAVGYGGGEVCVRRLEDGVIVGHLDAGPSALRHLGFTGTTHVVTYTHALPEPEMQMLPRYDPNAPTAPPDGLLRVWDLGGRLVAERQVGDLPFDERARAAIAASPDGSRVAVPVDKELLAIDLPAMKVAWSRRFSGRIYRVGFSSGDRFLVEWASPGPPRVVRVTALSLSDGRELGAGDVPPFELVALDARGPRAVVREAAPVGDASLLFREMQLWDVPRVKMLRAATGYTPPNGCREASLPQGEGVFSPDGSVLATLGSSVTLWDVERLAPIPRGPGHCDGVSHLELSPDGGRALSAGGDGTVRLWRVADGTELRRWSRDHTQASFSPDGTRILFYGIGTVSVLDAQTGRVFWEVKGRAGPAAFSPDGAYVATAGSDHDLTMHEAATGKVLWRHEPRMYGASVLAFTPDGNHIIADAETFDFAVWESRTGRLERNLGRHGQTVAMRGDGVLVFQQDRDVVLLPVDGGPAIVRPKISLGFPSFVLAADGARAFVIERDHVTLTRLDDGADLGRIDLRPFDEAPSSLALSRDGRRLIVGTGRGVILSFEIARGQ